MPATGADRTVSGERGSFLEVAVNSTWKTCRLGLVLGALIGLIACEGPGPLESGPDALPEVEGRQAAPAGLLGLLGSRGRPVRLVEVREGETLTNSDGRLTVPIGALLEDILITQAPLTDGTLGFRFGPNGLRFLRPAVLTISTVKAELSGVDPRRLRIAVASDDAEDWQVAGGIYSPLTRTVTVPVLHFSRYALCME